MKAKLNITGIIGLFLAIFLIVIIGMALSETEGIVLGQLINFWNIPSLAITVGGTMGGLIFSFPFSVIKRVPKLMGMAFAQKKYDPQDYITNMVEYCKIARLKGILQLEESANECTDPFMKSALMLIVDANDSEKVKAMLDGAIDFMCDRHESNMSFFLKGSASAPAFGMIGTLIGLINMLVALDPSNPDSANAIGAGMSTALITTFYGCIMAHVIFNPIATQLKYIHNQELLCMQIIEEGALAIISGANPRYVQEKLEILLSRSDVNKKAGGGKSKDEKQEKPDK